ncbi:MAG TPA: metallophosphoesterase [Trueperaceae bacterium]|nr:metallophosphoesterase [Trueperaceae bacterium]
MYTVAVVIGIISDIHANIIALEAVLHELKEKGADTIINLGDVVGYGPTPNEVIDLLRKERVFSTIGSADERIAYDFARSNIPREGVADSTLEWTRTVIEDKNIKYLRSLPVQLRLNTPAGRLRFFHGSPETPANRIDLNQDPLTIGKLLTKNRCNILVAGGSHVPFYKQYGKSWVINPGSVGLSLNGEPGADYALVKFDNTGEAIVTMGKVEYDFAAVAFDIIAWGLPDIVAEAVQQGKFPHTIKQDE